jgi:hypothetical protein
MYPSLTHDDVITCRTSRVRQVFAIPTIGYSRTLPPVATSVPGVHILNSAHIVNGTLNVDETVQLAETWVAGMSGGRAREREAVAAAASPESRRG